MENEKSVNKTYKYTESETYLILKEASPETFLSHLGALVSVARSEKEKKILEFSDLLLEFVINNEKPEMNERIITTTVDNIFKVLNRKT
jgi:hypothetical protein